MKHHETSRSRTRETGATHCPWRYVPRRQRVWVRQQGFRLEGLRKQELWQQGLSLEELRLKGLRLEELRLEGLRKQGFWQQVVDPLPAEWVGNYPNPSAIDTGKAPPWRRPSSQYISLQRGWKAQPD